MTNSTDIVHYSTSETQEYFFDEGCYILEVFNDPQHTDLSIARARVTPGVETALHALKGTIERYVIISGQGIATINSIEYPVKENDVISIAQGASQKIKNIGYTDLVFLAICTPRFTKDCYQTR